MQKTSELLAAFIERAVRASGRTWREVQERGGPAYETFREMRELGSTPQGRTLRKYETGIGLPPGTLDRVIDGENPELVYPRRRNPSPEQVAERLNQIEEEARVRGIEPEDVMGELWDELRRRRGPIHRDR